MVCYIQMVTHKDKLGINAFLTQYPLMSLRPSIKNIIVFEGHIDFYCECNNSEPVQGRFKIRIEVNPTFPDSIPDVFEIGNKIPKSLDYHTYSDGKLCLGSPIRLRVIIKKNPTISGFVQKCIIPHLYSCSIKLKNGGQFVAGELKHGKLGLYDDYKSIFNTDSNKQILSTLTALSNKKRIANKRSCPCGCGKRLGACKFHLSINEYRNVAPRSWFKKHYFEMTNLL